MDIAVITQIAQLGLSAVLLVILSVLWAEFKKQADYIREELKTLKQDHEDLTAGLRAFIAGDSDAAIKLRRIVADKAAATLSADLLRSNAVDAARQLITDADASAAKLRQEAADLRNGSG